MGLAQAKTLIRSAGSLMLGCIPAIVVLIATALLSQTPWGKHHSLPTDYFLADEGYDPSANEVMQLPEPKWTPLSSFAKTASGLNSHPLAGKATTRTIWFRHKIPASTEALNVVIAMPLMYVGSLDFFVVDDADKTTRRTLSSTDVAHWYSPMEPSMKIAAKAHTSQTVLGRFTSTRFLKAPLLVLSEKSYSHIMAERRLFLDLVKGAMVFMLMFSMVAYFGLKNPLYLFAAFFYGLLAIVLMSTSGEIFLYLPIASLKPETHQLAIIEVSTLAILNFGMTLTSIMAKMADFGATRRRWYIEIAMASVLLLAAPLLPSGFHIWIVVPLLALLVGELTSFLVAGHHKKAELRPVVAIGSFFWGAFAATLLSISGFLDGSFYGDNAYVVGEFLAALIITTEFARRTKIIEQERILALNQIKDGSGIAVKDSNPNLTLIRSQEEIDVSIMYIDIMSFSVITENRRPDVMFHELSRRLRKLTAIVEQFGGAIDRSLGDGLLCFFSAGADYHAIRAFKAATAIQHAILEEAQAITEQNMDRILLPVRIGIHTDKVVIANTAGSGQIDFTMVGQGVNFASNLEQACVPFQIMLSESTQAELLARAYPPTDFSATLIAVKHKSDLITAYRHNPCARQSQQVKDALALHYNQLGTMARELRYAIAPGIEVALQSPYGNHEIMDFSLYGFRTRSPSPLGQNAVFEATFVTQHQGIGNALREKLLQSLTLEVRWSHASDGCFEHGFKVVGSNQEQAHFRVAILLAASPLETDHGRAA